MRRKKSTKRSVVVGFRRRKGDKKAHPVTKSVGQLNQRKIIVIPRKLRTVYAGKETRKFVIHGREFWLAKTELVRELGIAPEDVEVTWRQAKEDRDKEAFSTLKKEALDKAQGEQVTQVKKSDSILDIVKIFGKTWVKTTLTNLQKEAEISSKKPEVPKPPWIDKPTGGWGEEMD